MVTSTEFLKNLKCFLFAKSSKNMLLDDDRSKLEVANVEFTTPTICRQPVKDSYPNGFSFEELQRIDFNRFGTMLKQKRLLPPSYDSVPSVVNIYRGRKDNSARVKLTFNSKTTDSYRVIGINGYDVDFAVNSSYLYEHSDILSKAWSEFADITRRRWEYVEQFHQVFGTESKSVYEMDL